MRPALPLSSVLPLLSALLSCSGPDKDSTATATDDTQTSQDDSGTTGTTDPGTVPLGGLCTDATRWGRFTIDSNVDYAYISGSVSDGVVPINILTELQTEGGCTIWRRENPFCDPGCNPDQTCNFDGTCVPYPVAQDIGTVNVSGLVQPSSMTPLLPNYSYFDTSLPNPPWTPGDLLTLRTTGGAFDPVTLHAVAPATLQPASLEWVLTDNQDFSVAWDAPAGAARTEVVLRLSVDQHGLTPASIVCTFPDTGAATVPGSIIHGLLSMGITGFPAGDIARRTADHADVGAGCMELIASSSHFAESVGVTGYTPCNFDTDCPDGLTCNEALQRCE